jgi:hypothetical protein
MAAAAGGAGAASAAAGAKFDPDTLLAHFSRCNAHVGDVPMEAFMSGLEQLKRIIRACARERLGRNGCRAGRAGRHSRNAAPRLRRARRRAGVTAPAHARICTRPTLHRIPCSDAGHRLRHGKLGY